MHLQTQTIIEIEVGMVEIVEMLIYVYFVRIQMRLMKSSFFDVFHRHVLTFLLRSDSARRKDDSNKERRKRLQQAIAVLSVSAN